MLLLLGMNMRVIHIYTSIIIKYLGVILYIICMCAVHVCVSHVFFSAHPALQ